jgi:hypothetical protein
MRTFIVPRGTLAPVQAVQQTQVAQATQYAVVSARFALALAGSKHFSSANGTLYGVFNTLVAAQGYIAERGLRLVATAIPW